MRKKIMQSIRLLCALASIFVIYSCKKDSPNISTTEEQTNPKTTASLMQSKDLVKSVASLKHSSLRRLAFDQLSPEEKSSYVNSRINQAILDLHLTQEQISVLKEVIAFVTPELYQSGGTLKGRFSSYTELWLPRAEKLFTTAELRYLLATHTTFKEYSRSINRVNVASTAGFEAGIPDCGCAGGDVDYDCAPDYKCDKTTTTCVNKDWGCGMLYLSACKYICIKKKK